MKSHCERSVAILLLLILKDPGFCVNLGYISDQRNAEFKLGKLLKKSILCRLFKNVQMQDAQELRNESYIEVRRCSLPPRKRGKLAAQRSRWTFLNSLLEGIYETGKQQ
ncbi:MAG: hypothetical protein CSYNP_02092 [Syntrophus sp. SKADARSKE-3]|nr:hypothetical protein [Syntrophus sp. SKADARSKE-3]